MYFEALRQSSQSRLLELIAKTSSGNTPKDFVIHDGLMKEIDQVAGARLLREAGIDKMFKLESSAPTWKNNTRIYFIPSTLSAAEQVVQHLATRSDGIANAHYHIFVFPKALSLINSFFESSGILDFTTIHNFCWDFIPLDKNFLSLELKNFFTATFLQGDDSYLGLVAKVLMSFECHYGKFSSVITLGEKSHKTYRLLSMWHSEFQPVCPQISEFSHLFVVDRNYDFAAPLLTQLTYEGVLDENFGIDTGFIYLKDSEGVQQRLMLNCAKDEIYAEIKGKHISAVFQHLSGKAKQLQMLRDKKNTDSIEEMKQFVSNELKVVQQQQKSLAAHISACEQVMKKQDGIMEELLALQSDIMSDSKSKEFLAFIEDSMARQVDYVIILRLLSLYCLMQDGVSEKEFLSLHRNFLQAYGFKYLPTLHRLQSSGLFFQRDSKLPSLELSEKLSRIAVSVVPSTTEKVPFKRVCQKLNLLTPEDAPEPTELIKGLHSSYVYGGIYTPLVYRIVERFLKEKEPMAGDLSRCFGPALRASGPNYTGAQQEKILVFFLGGVSLAEAAALSLLSQEVGRHIAVAATSTVNGNSLIETFAA